MYNSHTYMTDGRSGGLLSGKNVNSVPLRGLADRVVSRGHHR